MDRAAQFAVVAARGAVAADSGIDIDGYDPYRVGVTIGSAVGATMGLDEEYNVVSDGGRLHLVDHAYTAPHLYNYLVPSSFAAEVAWAVGAQGPDAVCTGCTSGIDSVGHAVELLREGSADVMITGWSDADLADHDGVLRRDQGDDAPGRRTRARLAPFDGTRNGFVLGEGAAVFVPGGAEDAKRRGAHIYAEIAGYATRSNAYHMTGLRPDGAEMAEAITVALDEARMNATEIDYINAHGSGTKRNRPPRPRRSSGAWATTSTRSARSSRWSGTRSARSAPSRSPRPRWRWRTTSCRPRANLATKPKCDLDYVPLVAGEQLADAVLTVGSGFGGFQSAMVLARPERSVA